MTPKFLLPVVAVFLLAIPAIAQKPTQELPFFFPPGIQQTTDPILQLQEYQRYLISGWACNQGNKDGGQSLIPEPGSISIQTDIVSTSSVTENPAKMRVVLDHFIRMPDGRIRVTTLCSQFFITARQEKVVEDELISQIQLAAKRDNDFYQVIMNLAIAARAKKLGVSIEQFKASLDEPMLDDKNITYREFNRIPKPSKASDFIPRELHLGFNIPLGGILGVTWLNTGIIYYNPQAWIVDYLTGVPKIIQHEMVHNNINVEKFPMSEAYDAELLADMPIVLYPENKIDLPAHSYATDLRELFHIYFNFDFDEMNSQIYKVDLAGNKVIDPIKYRYYYDQLELVKAEALAFFQQVTIPEFYSDIAWWGSVNDIRGDKNSVFRMTLAQHYNPTILGSAKVSLDWAEAHRQEIMDTAQQAFDNGIGAGTKSTDDDDTIHAYVPSYLIDLYNRTFTADERQQIETYYRAHPEELKKLRTMTPAQLIELAKKWKSSTMNLEVQ